MSTFIKSVTFTLHESFRQNQRIIDHFPFEVREQGWGEFEIKIKIEFKNDAEYPVTLSHSLKLHPLNREPSKENVPVVNEIYDEFVFNEPTEYMYQLLMTPLKIPPLPSESIYWVAFNESECLSIIMRAQNYITEELIRTRDMLIESELRSVSLTSKQQNPPVNK